MESKPKEKPEPKEVKQLTPEQVKQIRELREKLLSENEIIRK